MARYSQERKDSILKKLLPPHNLTVAEVAREEGMAVKTLYHWRDIHNQLHLLAPLFRGFFMPEM